MLSHNNINIFTRLDTEQFIERIDELCDSGHDIVFDGNLDCRDSDITRLPDNLTVYGFLDISYLKLGKLPKNLVIKGGLFCKYNELRSLPDDMQVQYTISCEYNNISTYIKSKCEYVFMDDKQKIIYNRVVKCNKLKAIIKKKKYGKEKNIHDD